MRLFIDSAKPELWETFAEAGLLYGVTTNPLIFTKESVDFSQINKTKLIDAAKALGLAELQFQVTGLHDPTTAVADFMALFEQWPNGIVAKVPFAKQTTEVLSKLDTNVPITFTTGYSADQAVIARAKNARYIAPYYGRLMEAGEDADQIVDDMLAICAPETRVLVASLRSANQVSQLAARGHNTFTLAPQIFADLLTNKTSQTATDQFEQAAADLIR